MGPSPLLYDKLTWVAFLLVTAAVSCASTPVDGQVACVFTLDSSADFPEQEFIENTFGVESLSSAEEGKIARLFNTTQEASDFCSSLRNNTDLSIVSVDIKSLPSNTNGRTSARACCGFLCLGTCPKWYTVRVVCRCHKGCPRTWYVFQLPEDREYGYCSDRYKENYNEGEWCHREYGNMRLGDSFKFYPKTGAYGYSNFRGSGKADSHRVNDGDLRLYCRK